MKIKQEKKEQKNTERERYAEELFEIMRKIASDKALLKEFFVDILTPAEYKEIGVRWQIVKRLAKGEPQRKIAEDLGVSIATVTRGSRELLDKQGGFQRVLDKMETRSK